MKDKICLRVICYALLALYGASALAACERDQQIKACSIVSRAEVEAALDMRVESVVSDETGVSTCSFGTVPGRSDSLVFIWIRQPDRTMRGGYGDTPAVRSFEFARREAERDGSVEPVGGIGDDAFWNPVYHYLHVRRDEVHFHVYVSTSIELARAFEAAQAIARRTVERIDEHQRTTAHR